jgi:hypothetical protein
MREEEKGRVQNNKEGGTGTGSHERDYNSRPEKMKIRASDFSTPMLLYGSESKRCPRE